jgi:hypothetical protein
MGGPKVTLINSKILPVLFLALLALGLASCSPPKPKTKTAIELQQQQQDREKWRKATLLGEYEKVGRKDPRWDEPAKNALDSFANLQLAGGEEQNQDFHTIGRFADQAVQAGCDDALIKYLYVMLDYNAAGHSNNEVIQTYAKAADDMHVSSYSEIRKFYACIRPAMAVWNYEPMPRTNFARLRNLAGMHLERALEDPTMPPGEARDACLAILKAFYNSKQGEGAYHAIEKPLFKNFANSSAPYAIKGAFYMDFAWQARGEGSADTVTPDGWKLFGERLKIAEAAYQTGWQIEPGDPLIPTQMLRVVLGLTDGRDKMELWFQRAMKADPNNWEACNYKLYYLYPRWHGSYEDMIAFGRECSSNQAWGGAVRLYIGDAHFAVANDSGQGTNYWKQPDVWPEIHQAYEGFFQRNPDAISFRHNYL